MGIDGGAVLEMRDISARKTGSHDSHTPSMISNASLGLSHMPHTCFSVVPESVGEGKGTSIQQTISLMSRAFIWVFLVVFAVV